MKRVIVSIILIVLTLFLASGCKQKTKQEEKIIPVKTVIIKPGDIFSYVSVMGIVDSKIHTWIKATTEGFVKSLTVKEGSYVHEGQIVCYIMPVDSQNMLGQANVEFTIAKREYENADASNKEMVKARYEEAKKILESSYNLYKPVPAVSPVSGTVLSKTIENGTMVSLKQNLVEIADLRKLIVRASLPEELIAKVKVGDTVAVRVQNDSNEIHLAGRISVITYGINPISKTEGVEITILPHLILKPGMTSVVDFITDRRSATIVVPVESILVDYQGNKKVFIVKDGKAVEKTVVTGIESNTQIEIRKGLSFGDELVVLGHENCKDGIKVKVVNQNQEKLKKKKSNKGE
ncbi:MAG: efflux RND transporter periplasmic adaptor subunit [Spirochaetota bacterium]